MVVPLFLCIFLQSSLAGNSSGSLLDTSASYPYAVGLTSGNNGSGNVFTRIVKETVGLVGELL